MGRSDTFEPWLRGALAAELDALTRAATAHLKADRLRGLRWSLVQLIELFEGREKSRMIFGAIIDSVQAAALRGPLEVEVRGLLKGVELALIELVSATLGVVEGATPPRRDAKGFWGRAKALFSSPEVTAGVVAIGEVSVEPELAKSIIEQSPENVVLQMLGSAQPGVRAAAARWLMRAIAFRRPLEKMLANETELEVVLAAATTLSAMGSMSSVPALQAALSRATTPEARAAVISALASLSVTDRRRYAASKASADRLAVVHALTGTPEVVAFFNDPDEHVVLAAVAASLPTSNLPSVGDLKALARTGSTAVRLAAFIELEPFAERQPAAILDLLIALTSDGGPLRARAYPLLATAAKYRRFSARDLALLRQAQPKLDPESAAAKAIHRLLERDQPTVHPSSSELEELEAQIDANPDDEHAWLVFADTLQSQGDVRGELIALSHANQPILQLVTENLESLLGPVCALYNEGHGTVLDRSTWKHGFLDVVTASLREEELDDISMPQLAVAIVSSPLARFISELRIGLASYESHDNDYNEVLATLARVPHTRRLRSLVLGEFEYPDDMEISWAPWGDVGSVWSLMPRLEKLYLRGAGGALGTGIEAPELRALTLESGGLPAENIESIVEMRAPKLENLELWLGSVDYGSGCTEAHFETLFSRSDLPELRSLALKNSEIIDSALPFLIKSPLVKQLRRLDFSMCILGDEAIDALEAAHAALSHLEELKLSQNNFSDEGVKRLQQRFPNAVLDDQRGPDERYVPVGE